jgi:hypothetical protein
MKTLQEHFNLIKEGKGNKAQFLKQARSLFPEYFNQYTDFDTATNVLKSKQIINESAGGVVAKGFSVYDWKKILGEEVKAMEKETSKEVLDNQKNAYQPSNMKDADNINFNEIMKGFFAEMYDEKNKEKTGDEIKAMVVKNLAKDPLYYTKNGNFSTMGVGYTDEAPGLGTPKEPKGKFKSSGYGDIEKEIKVKANVKDSLGDQEAKDSMPKKVKEMPDKGVSGIEKKMKLQENKETSDEKITRYEKYTYILDDKEVKPDEIAFYDHLLGAEIDGKLYKIGIPSEDGKVKLTLRENKETSDEKIARYKKYTYTLDGKEVKPDDIDFYDHLLGAKMGDRFYRIGIPSEDGKVKLKLRENTDEALYQGPSVKIGAGGGLGGRRFIPNVTVLSRDAVDAINAKGARRLNWGKPHIKIVKSGDGVKLLISKLLVDTIVGSERGRSKLSLSVSKMGTGIIPEEMSELSGEFKKLVKVLNTGGKLSQNGDYFLLDVPTKYNEKRNQFEMPLPAEVAESEMSEGEQQLRSLIRNLINEELNSSTKYEIINSNVNEESLNNILDAIELVNLNGLDLKIIDNTGHYAGGYNHINSVYVNSSIPFSTLIRKFNDILESNNIYYIHIKEELNEGSIDMNATNLK